MLLNCLVPLAISASCALVVSLPNLLNDGGRQAQHALGAVIDTAESSFSCDLPSIRTPSSEDFPDSGTVFAGKRALEEQIKRLGEVVKVPSVCYDDLGDFDLDTRWLPFYQLHDTLNELFPLVHKHMKVTKVNRFGLIYTLYGTNKTLSPILLTAHQDVVPVPDPTTWTHPPFSADFDGTYLWGRGSSDDKNSLVALLSVLESLLSLPNTFKPPRTIILAFGFDEECSGARGAGHIATYLEQEYGTNSIAMILDEGGMGFQLLNKNTLYALPAVQEKGHVDIWFDLQINGGHSSTPFPHTGIGVIAEIITILESNPYTPKLIKNSPIYNHLVCQARYSPTAAPKITELLENDDLDALANELVSMDRGTQFRIQTSQAADVISGGAKINAMPEHVRLGVNYRVAPHNSIEEIKKNVVDFITPVVEKYAIDLEAFTNDDDDEEGALRPTYEVNYNASLRLTAPSKSSTPPTPISPSVDSAVWDLFAGTIRHSFAFKYTAASTVSGTKNEEVEGLVVPAPELMTGNTDTRHYVNLSRNIYRWNPKGWAGLAGWEKGSKGYREGGRASENIHTVNEKMDMEEHVQGCRFYYDLIVNFATAVDI